MVEIKIGVVSSPLQADYGGDAYLIKELPGKVLLAVVDALGHGQMARRAASRTIKLLAGSDGTELDKLLESTHKAITGTVGVVLCIALVDYKLRQLTFAGVGNITIKIIGKKTTEVVLPAGILGYRTDDTLYRVTTISQNDVLIMHTDGILDNYELNPSLLSFPKQMAQALMSGYRRPTDDALVLVATELLNEGYEEQLLHE
ncbi:MAG: SpoIIE family protein phosphatase [Desulfitobacteriaceae bacterium]